MRILRLFLIFLSMVIVCCCMIPWTLWSSRCLRCTSLGLKGMIPPPGDPNNSSDMAREFAMDSAGDAGLELFVDGAAARVVVLPSSISDSCWGVGTLLGALLEAALLALLLFTLVPVR